MKDIVLKIAKNWHSFSFEAVKDRVYKGGLVVFYQNLRNDHELGELTTGLTTHTVTKVWLDDKGNLFGKAERVLIDKELTRETREQVKRVQDEMEFFYYENVGTMITDFKYNDIERVQYVIEDHTYYKAMMTL